MNKGIRRRSSTLKVVGPHNIISRRLWKFKPSRLNKTASFLKKLFPAAPGYTSWWLVCPQIFSHSNVMCKVCQTASNTLFNADAFVQLNHWILSNIWRVKFLVVRLIKLAEHILLNSQYDLLAISKKEIEAEEQPLKGVSGANSLGRYFKR